MILLRADDRQCFCRKGLDLPRQSTVSRITADNESYYQLREVAEANARVHNGGSAR